MLRMALRESLSMSPILVKESGWEAIDDESLNDAFLAIWLSPKTEYQTLRQQLLGMNR